MSYLNMKKPAVSYPNLAKIGRRGTQVDAGSLALSKHNKIVAPLKLTT